MRRHAPAVVVLVACVLVASSCGARMDRADLQAGDRLQRGGGASTGAASTDGDVGPGDPSAAGGGTAAGDATTTGGAGAPDAGTTGGASAGSATGGATSGGATGPGSATTVNRATNTASDVGVTPDSITLGLVTTLTGPVPGLFRGAVVGTQAGIAYANSRGGVHGRRLRLVVGDDKLSADENRAQVIRLSTQVLSFLGSFSVYDEAGVPEMARRNVPDIGSNLSEARYRYPRNFAPQPNSPGWRLAGLKAYKQRFPEATQAVGALVVNVGSPREAWAWARQAMESLGYRVVYERFYQPTETDFTADVVQMRREGVKFLTGSGDAQNYVRIARSMQQQNWKPEVINWPPNAYDARYAKDGGSGADGALIDMSQAMYLGEDAGQVPAVNLMKQWVERISPGFNLDLFTLYGWTASQLFVQAATAAGPNLTRDRLVEEIKKIHDFDAGGLLPKTDVGNKKQSDCTIFVRIRGGRFVRESPAQGFTCGGGFHVAR